MQLALEKKNRELSINSKQKIEKFTVVPKRKSATKDEKSYSNMPTNSDEFALNHIRRTRQTGQFNVYTEIIVTVGSILLLMEKII